MSVPRVAFTAGPADAGQTLAALVRRAVPGLPWSRARKLVADGRVTVDGRVERDPAVRVRARVEIVVDPHARPRDPGPPVTLLHVDAHVVVADKPAGLISVPYDDERDTLQHRAHALVKARERRPVPPLRVVQRLDKDTSGVLVFARTRAAERALAAQLRVHDVERRYLALCEGRPRTQTHDTWLVRDRGDGRRGSARGRPPAGARRAITRVEALRWFAAAGVSLVACRLETGRQHQIRIHLAEAGHPLLGERVYGRRDRPVLVAADRPMLHAQRLGFRHPATDRIVTFETPPPPDFAALLDALDRAG